MSFISTLASPQSSANAPSGKVAGLRETAALAITLIRNVAYDAWRFWRHSFIIGVRNREHLRARMRRTGHFIEYGMSLSNPRPGYGLERIRLLATDLETYITCHGHDSTSEIMLRTLETYIAFHQGLDIDLGWLEAIVLRLRMPVTGLGGGTETVSREAIQSAAAIDFMAFSTARHSIRQFAPGPVAPDVIRRAVAAAQNTPSSCNRQTCRVDIWTDQAMVRRVLALQSGNRGFGDQLAGVAVIWSDLTHWYEVEERYQGWIDGGMFAMSLCYALHAEGLGTVMLNWGVELEQDKALRALTGLPESALVCTFLGFGHLPETLAVPLSQREPVDHVLTLNRPLRPGEDAA